MEVKLTMEKGGRMNAPQSRHSTITVIHSRRFLDDLHTGSLSSLIMHLSLVFQNAIHKLPDNLLQPPMALLIIRRLESFTQPRRFSIRNLRNVTWLWGNDLNRLSLHNTNLETSVTGCEEDFVTVEREECFGCVFACYG